MKKTSKNIIRIVAIAMYLLLISITVFIISSLYSYLNTGADRSSMLHIATSQNRQYTPKINWKEDGNEGREIPDQTLKKIENDYLNSWYVKNIAEASNTKDGIEDYYTKNARRKIYKSIDYNKSEEITIDCTSINHNADIKFFSEDGQLVVLEDKDVLEYTSIYKKDSLFDSFTTVSDYKVLLLLEDGFWRVRHKVKEVEKTYKKESSNNIYSLNIKGINYYPQKNPWDTFGDYFNEQVFRNDFSIIKKAGLNTIRIFIGYEDFGKENVAESKLEKLGRFLTIAQENDLQVVVTLFDFYGNYSVLDWTFNHRHAEAIVSRFKNHPAILAWDVKNEPNLDFKSRGKQKVLAWLEHMVLVIKNFDRENYVTIGWSNMESATLLQDDVDFVSFHYYEDVETFEEKYDDLKKSIKNKPLVLGEFGLSSYSGIWNFFGGSKEKQANYHLEMQKVLTSKDIPFMSWTLYDFDEIPESVVGKLSWRKNPQKKFGFIDANGNKKPAFQHIAK